MSGSWSDFETAAAARYEPARVTLLCPAEQPAVADLARRCADLAGRVAELEGLLADERRQHAATRDRTFPTPRKAPLWLLPFAYVGLAWGRYTDSYAYEPQEETP